MAGHQSRVEGLLISLSNACAYPRNGCGVEIQPHTADVLEQQLQLRAGRLFCSESKASIEILELNKPERGMLLHDHHIVSF